MSATLAAPSRAQSVAPAVVATSPPSPVTVMVSGRAMEINGVREVPRGLFGVHATPLDEKTAKAWGVELVRLIHHHPQGAPTAPGSRPDTPANVSQILDCFYDRYQPARLLHDPNWKANLEALARNYGKAAQGIARPVLLEFWNEPYLNWAANPGVNYDGQFYDRSDTAPGARMKQNGVAQPTEYLVWDAPRLVAIDPEKGTTDYVATRFIPKEINGRTPQAGDEWMFRGHTRRRLEIRQWGKDTTQTSHQSALQNSLWYRQMLLPFARALKIANPDVQLIAGWGCHLQYDKWNAWHQLYQPLLDEAHPWIDGLNEHHYGNDTRMVPAAYETAAAYAKTKWNKDLKFYNTEAGGSLDPEQPGNNAKPTFEAHNYEERDATMTYTLRDILHLLNVCPDKAVTRAAHMAHLNGDRYALELLKDVRGELMEVTSSNPAVWAVAARSNSTLVVALWNDGNSSQQVSLRTDAPGYVLQQPVRREAVREGEHIRIQETSAIVAAKSNALQIVSIGPRRCVVFKFDLLARPMPLPRQASIRTQYYAPQILQKIEPGQAARFAIALPSQALEKTARAQLRFVLDGTPPEGLSCTLNGARIKLQSSPYTNDVVLPRGVLRAQNTLEFNAGKPFQINTASLLITHFKIG